MSPRTLAVALLLLLPLSALGQVQGPGPGGRDTRSWHRLVGILQYLEADYPLAVESGSEFELAEQKAFIAEALVAAKELGPEGAPFVERIQAVEVKVLESKEPSWVSAECGALVEALVRTGGLERSPRHKPDLARGAALYQEACAACHAKDGSAQVEIAANMEPRPANFLDPELLAGLSPYKAYNTTSFGVPGTGMPAYSTLTEDERWSLGFYVFTLRQPPCEGKPPKVALAELASSTDADLEKRYGKDALACLRRKLPGPDTDESFRIAQNGVDDAIDKGSRGDFGGARQALIDAYLMGVEPLEPLIAAKHPERVREIEAVFLEARMLAERKDPAFVLRAQELKATLERVADRTQAATPVSVFWLAFFILLREGFEAMVVVAALLAVLKKTGELQQARVVHAGWVSALLVGVLAFVFGRHLISGANREWVEGVVALVAVAMLLYAAFWLNARVNVRRFMGELRSKVQGAVGRGSVAGLFGLSFMAAFRESFETALFLQGLALDSLAGTAWGALAGAVALGAFVFMVSRVGYKLPMKPLFTASTVLLFATAVVLLGKGLRALQEVGALPIRPVSFVHVELLGVYPDLYTLLAQGLLLLAPLGYFLWRRHAERNTPRVESITQAGA